MGGMDVIEMGAYHNARIGQRMFWRAGRDDHPRRPGRPDFCRLPSLYAVISRQPRMAYIIRVQRADGHGHHGGWQASLMYKRNLLTLD